MNIKPLAVKRQQSTVQAQALANWVEAAFKLHENYKNLVACLNKNEAEKGWDTGKRPYIGQCPVNELVILLVNMQLELEKLLQDMDQASPYNQYSHKKNSKKLAAHTKILDQLNQQAQTRLLLTTFTTA